jgi:hypothetical protein
MAAISWPARHESSTVGSLTVDTLRSASTSRLHFSFVRLAPVR